jgi:hypothetical protein
LGSAGEEKSSRKYKNLATYKGYSEKKGEEKGEEKKLFHIENET